MSDVKLTNIPSMNVGKMVEKLSQAYSAVIKNRLPIKTMPSVMLWGPPGVGKSQAIRQIARDIEASTGKTVKVTDVRLLLFNPIDLRGIPTSNADKTLRLMTLDQEMENERLCDWTVSNNGSLDHAIRQIMRIVG